MRSLPLLLPFLAAACSIEGPDFSFDLGAESQGDLGVLEFTLQSNRCLFGCAIDRSFATETSELVAVDGDSRLASSALAFAPEGIATATLERTAAPFTQFYRIDALVPGATQLQVVDLTSGAIIDTLTIEVSDIASFEASWTLADGEHTSGPLDLTLGSNGVAKDPALLSLEAADLDGAPLFASTAFLLEVLDPQIATLGDFNSQSGLSQARSDFLLVNPEALGVTEISITTANGPSLQLDVIVR